MEDARKSAWRKQIEPDWNEKKQKLDWMSVPGVRSYVDSFFPDGQSWVQYARNYILAPLANKKPSKGIRLLSIGCGSGVVDQACISAGWPISEYHLAEYDDVLLESARSRVESTNRIESVIAHRFDYEAIQGVNIGRFDAIFFCHSIHHCNDIEGLLSFLSRSLEPHGKIFGADYFGGARLQPDFETLPILDKIFNSMPSSAKVNLSSNMLEQKFAPLDYRRVMAHDPSEAPRSGDLRSLFLSQLRNLETIPMGGTLLRPLLANRAGHFTECDESMITFVKILCILEGELIKSGRIKSDDLFFVGEIV